MSHWDKQQKKGCASAPYGVRGHLFTLIITILSHFLFVYIETSENFYPICYTRAFFTLVHISLIESEINVCQVCVFLCNEKRSQNLCLMWTAWCWKLLLCMSRVKIHLLHTLWWLTDTPKTLILVLFNSTKCNNNNNCNIITSFYIDLLKTNWLQMCKVN